MFYSMLIGITGSLLLYLCWALRDGPFDIQGDGGLGFFKKNSLFPNIINFFIIFHDFNRSFQLN